MLVIVVASIIWVGISAYAVFGSADFGAGMWDLVAGDEVRGREPRRLIESSIGPVWEANHVWLIFVFVFFWTAFPQPFVSIATTLWIPLTLAAFGIIFRGAGFAFRKWADTTNRCRFYGAAFAGASLVTPFFLGAVVGAVASGRVPLGNAAGDPWRSWLTPTSVLGGILAVTTAAFGAAVLLTHDAHRQGDAALTAYFRRRATLSGLVTGAVALAGIAVLAADAPDLFASLSAPVGAALLVISALGGLSSLAALRSGRYDLARPLAVVAIVSVLWGWGAGQYPWALRPVALATDYAAGDETLWALVIVFIAAGFLAIPALLLLGHLVQRGHLDAAGPSRGDSTDALMSRLAGGGGAGSAHSSSEAADRHLPKRPA